MPHVAVMMYPGRSEETKKALAHKIQALIMEELKLPETAVSVSMFDIEKEAFPNAMLNIPQENIVVGQKPVPIDLNREEIAEFL